MASVASQLIEEVTAHAQSDSLEDVREICADGTYFPNNLRMYLRVCVFVCVRRRIIVVPVLCWRYVPENRPANRKNVEQSIFPLRIN